MIYLILSNNVYKVKISFQNQYFASLKIYDIFTLFFVEYIIFADAEE